MFDLFDGESDGEFFLGFGELDFGEGVFGEALTVGEVFVEGAEGCEAEADGGACGVGLHEFVEVGTEVVGGEVEPIGEGIADVVAVEAEGAFVVREGVGGGVFLGAHELEKSVFQAVGIRHYLSLIKQRSCSGCKDWWKMGVLL